ncbi:hypothetical protein A3Q56_00521 [Intoshia linei]|uniref:Uncharacterized protein n=1 Tax=Intoshia linei TaxID=1819745 RepID=A0A177BBW0_9BILA|nr:hypothetical protein A3Q56_00521 [Intoshia linei]
MGLYESRELEIIEYVGAGEKNTEIPVFIQSDLNLSNTQVLKLAKHLRVTIGRRQCMEPNVKTELQIMNHSLDNFFTLFF